MKHDAVVDKELGRFEHFVSLVGKELDSVPLDVQFYSDAVFEFVGAVLEVVDDRVSSKTIL